MADNAATFDISLRGDLKAQSREASAALAELKIRLKDNQDEVDHYREQLKALRAQSGDTSGAQRELKDKLDTLKKTMQDQRATAGQLRDRLGELRQRTKEQSEAAKAVTAQHKALDGALKNIGGPVQALRDKWDALKSAFTAGNVATVLAAGGLALLVVGLAAAAAGVVALTAKFAKWALVTADEARTLGLLQEAVAGSAENSAAMTSQIDAMARRVPTARGELQKLYEETYRLTNHTRMSGDAIQSTYEAIAQSSAAMGDSVGKQIGDLITRSAMWGKIRIGRLDVGGTGLDYEKDLVAPLAKAMHKVGPITGKEMAEARNQLAIGGLKMDAGAKFVADAINRRFGDINLRQLLSLDVQWRRLKETFVSFTRGINLEPLLKALDRFFAMFHEENSVGAALKELIEDLGNGMVGAAAKSGPKLEDFIKNLLADVLFFEADIIKAHGSLEAFFKTGADDLLTNLKEVYEIAKDIATVLGWVNNARKAAGGAIASIVNRGQQITAEGLQEDAKRYRERAVPIEGGYKPHEIRESPAHAEGGIVGVPAPGEFWASVAPGEQIVPAGRSAGSSGLVLNLTINATGKGGEEIAGALTETSFVEQFTHMLEGALIGAGIQVREVPT